MFKLQVVLVPPSAQNALLGYGLASSTAESSQLMGVNPMTAPRNGETTLPYAASGNNSMYPYHFASRSRKFLHFTKSANSLLDLSAEIDQKCVKMYPFVDELEILSLQDSQGCDLDPDFLVKDVFTMDNVVRVIIKNELEIDDSSPVSSYRAVKRKKLSSGVAQSPPAAQGLQAPASSASSGVLNIAKKRPAAFAMRHSTNSSIRVSTPLVHQIYPPPATHDRMISNNSEDEDDDPGERSFLPPPAQPQSPPIRISSGMDTGKRIKSMVEDDTVSRSETVDPDKLKQQRLLSGTPVRPTMTPNRVTLTGQRVVSEHQSSQPSNTSVFTAPNSNRKNSFATTRITSGRLSIPEPKIAEIEKELKEGPSSPSSMLPPKADRIPMKKPYQETDGQPSDEYDSSEEQEADKQVRAFIQRQTSSIADNNGSPTKNSPLSDDDHVRLAELPQTSPSSSAGSQQRKTSLEARVQHKLSGGYVEEEPLRIDHFSEDEDEGVQEKEHDRQWEGQLGRTRTQRRQIDEENDIDGNDAADETVVVRDSHHRKPSANNSIRKEELLRFMEGDYLPAWNKHSSKRKPYTTVLRKDIDNSKPDPRNILPERMTRNAAKRAAQILAGKAEQSSESETELHLGNSSGDVSSSGIESDASLGDEDGKIAITENDSVKTLTIHPLKETVIEGDETSSQIEDQPPSSKLDSERSAGTSFGSSTDQEQNNSFHGEQGQIAAERQPPEQAQAVASLLNPLKRSSFSLGHREKPIIQVSPSSRSPKGGDSGDSNQIKFQLPSGLEKQQLETPKTAPPILLRSSTFSSDHSQSQPASVTSALKKEGTTRGHASEIRKDDKLEQQVSAQGGREVHKQADKGSKQRTRENARRAKEEEMARRRQEREEKKRLKHEELERKKKLQQEEKKRLQEEKERRKEEGFKKQQEVLENRKQVELEKRRQEFSERKGKEELESQKREEEERKKEAETVKNRLEDLGRRKREEIERKKQMEFERMRKEELENKKQEELKMRKQEENEMEKKLQEELEKKRKLQEELQLKQKEEQEGKRLQEELEQEKQAALEKKRQEEEQKKEFERRRRAEVESKRQQEEIERKKLAELEKKEQELQKKQQEELQREKEQEELQRKKLQEELQRKKEQEDLQKKKEQEELQKKKQQEELQKKKEQEELQEKKREELQRKRQAEQEKKKQQDELKRKQSELERKKQEQAKKKSKSAYVSKSAKPSAAINGSDKLKELKARFTSSKAYIPASLKGKQQSKRASSNNDMESSEEESSTEYSSSSEEEEDEPSSKESRRKVVDTPKGSVTTGNQKSPPKKLPVGDGVKFAPQSTQRSNLSSQLSQNEVPVTRMMDRTSLSSSQMEPSGNSSILGGLPKKIRPSLSSLSDLVSRGVPEVKEKSSSSQDVAKTPSKGSSGNSDDKESDDIDDSETESESSNSESDDSDSGDNSFISAKTASTALGKKKKGNGGFASLIRDSQKI